MLATESARRKFRPLVMRACGRNLGYDTQIEGTRALSIFCCFIMDYSANWREVIVPVIAVHFFGAATFMSVRDTMRRWREISRLQEFLGAMPDDELQKFDAAVGQSDFELYTAATGKTHFRTVDYEVHEEI